MLASDRIGQWCDQLHERALREMSFPQLRKAVQALSTVYIQKRDRLARGAALDSAGKRAAFASFYAPLHLLTVRKVLGELGSPAVQHVVDLGCGTGAAGVAWATGGDETVDVTAVDSNAWAVSQAQQTLRDFGIPGRALRKDAVRFTINQPGQGLGIVLAYTVNELPDDGRVKLGATLLRAAAQGTRILIVEPIARKPVPWWDEWAEMVKGHGGRADEWRFSLELPAVIGKLDRAARLNHAQTKCRSLFF